MHESIISYYSECFTHTLDYPNEFIENCQLDGFLTQKNLPLIG